MKVKGMLPPCGVTMRNVLVSWVSRKMAATRSTPDQGRFRPGTVAAGEVGEPAEFSACGAREAAGGGEAPGVSDGGAAPEVMGGGALPVGVGSVARFASRATSPEIRRMRAKWMSRAPTTKTP